MAAHRKRVGVIGAGISGLASAKELKDVGVDCDVYEMMPVLGGAFAHYGWCEGKLTSSTAFTWFSDFPIREDRQRHLPWDEWLDYLQRYVDHFGIADRLHFNCKVVKCERNAAKGGWDLRIHRAAWSNGHWTHPSDLQVEERVFEEHYDVLVLGSGLHNVPHVPHFEGEESFLRSGGTITHSSSFRSAEAYAGQRVVVVGGGESGSDIAYLVSKRAEKVAISLRSAPGTLFPHRIHGQTADIRDNRLVYSLPRAAWRLVLSGHRHFYEKIVQEEERRAQFLWAADSNFRNEQCIFTINACKSFGIPKAVTLHGASTHGAIAEIEGRTVRFAGGGAFEADHIVLATGFRAEIPAVADPELREAFADPRSLWHNMALPGVEDLFLLGFCRPHQINLITCCEMQARAMAQVVSGRKPLPPARRMREEIAGFKRHMARTFGRGYSALVDFIPFADGLAEFIGCAPDFSAMLFADPMQCLYAIFGPFQPCQYRLHGPGACPKLAREVIMETPFYSRRAERIRRDAGVFLMCCVGALLAPFGAGWGPEGRLRPVFHMANLLALAVTVRLLLL